jgi:CheY-like chemotaxis protein
MLEDRAQPMQANAPAFLNGKRVLIVEDQSLVGLALKESLQDAGADVVWVQSDRAAYTALQGNGLQFAVLILDVDLGHGTTGFDIARFARQRDPDVGVIFSSGSPPDWINTFRRPRGDVRSQAVQRGRHVLSRDAASQGSRTHRCFVLGMSL